MICKHTFIRINDASMPRGGVANAVSWNGQIAGATAGCIHCGQIRAVYEDGTVRILVEGGKPIDEDHG